MAFYKRRKMGIQQTIYFQEDDVPLLDAMCTAYEDIGCVDIDGRHIGSLSAFIRDTCYRRMREPEMVESVRNARKAKLEEGEV